jgi:hypothetical protein
MTLADLFNALTAAGIRLAAAGEQLELRGSPDAITPEIRAGAAEHKAELLALLTPLSQALSLDRFDRQDDAGRVAFPFGGNLAQTLATDDAAQAIAAHDWRDWRFEWLAEVGLLHLRMRECQDEAVLARLRPLADAAPRRGDEWLVLGRRIRSVENDLRLAGKLPAYHWPASQSGLPER